MLAALLCTLLFSFSITCAHRSATLIGGTEANFWRLSLAGLFLGLWAYTFGLGTGGKAFPLFFLSGVFGIGIGDVAFFQALPRLGSRLSSLLINCMSAPIAALIEWLWMGTTLSTRQVLWGLVTLAGVSIVLAPHEHLHRKRSDKVIGTLCAALAAAGGALGGVFSRKAYAVVHLTHGHLDCGTAGFQRALGGVLLGGAALLVAKRQELPVQLRAPFAQAVAVSGKKWRTLWPWVLLNAFAGQTLGVSCMQWALERTPAGIVFAILAITPIMIIPFACALEGEKPTRQSLLGALIAVGGVVALALSG